MEINEETLKKVLLQRDALASALSSLEDKLRHGMYNHIFGDGEKRIVADSKCDGGYKRFEIMMNAGAPCAKCSKSNSKCHASLCEYDVFCAMAKAKEVLGRPDAEMPELRPEDFPRYDPNAEPAKLTPRQIARMMYRVVVGYMLSTINSKDQDKAWERAYEDTLCIALGEEGRLWRKIADAKHMGMEAAEAWVKEHPEAVEFMKKANKYFEHRVDPREDIRGMLYAAMILQAEYRFDHEYPGADRGVYHDAFMAIVNDCLIVAGLYPEDRPNSYDFEDKDEYERKLLEYEAERKAKIYKFMQEED